MTTGRFVGRVALVTGAASGIGRATALRLAAEGARVLACDVTPEPLEGTVGEVVAAGGVAAAFAFDVREGAACRAALDRCVAEFGRIDLLCNVAGVMSWGRVTDITEAEWQRVLSINLTSVFLLSQAAIPHLLETSGTIVNVASAAGLVGQAYTSAYSVSKAGIIEFTRCVALEYAKQGLRCVAVCPGGVKTPLIHEIALPPDADMTLFAKLQPLMPLAESEEIAAAIAYLASPEARFVNGAWLTIDGAQTAG